MPHLDPAVERGIELTLQRPGPYTDADLTELESLPVRGPRDLSSLARFTGLRVLLLIGYVGRDLSVLAEHPALENVTVEFSAVADVDALATVRTLSRIYLRANAIEDVSALRTGLPRLREVDLTGNPLSEESYRKVVPELRERARETVTVSGEREWLITRRLYAAGIPFDYFRKGSSYRLCRPGLDYTDMPQANHARIEPDELEAILDRDPARVHDLFGK